MAGCRRLDPRALTGVSVGSDPLQIQDTKCVVYNLTGLTSQVTSHRIKPGILHVLFPDVRAEILRRLFVDPTHESYGRELARATTLALRTVQQELATLSTADLLTVRSDGFRRFYRANRKHPLFNDLQGLAIKCTSSVPFVSQHKKPRRSSARR